MGPHSCRQPAEILSGTDSENIRQQGAERPRNDGRMPAEYSRERIRLRRGRVWQLHDMAWQYIIIIEYSLPILFIDALAGEKSFSGNMYLWKDDIRQLFHFRSGTA